MRRLISGAVHNPVAANLLMVVIIVVGGMSAYNLRRETFPRISFDTIQVHTLFPGATPEEVEESIVVKIEGEDSSPYESGSNYTCWRYSRQPSGGRTYCIPHTSSGMLFASPLAPNVRTNKGAGKPRFRRRATGARPPAAKPPLSTPGILAPATGLAYPVSHPQTEIRTTWQRPSTPATTS